MTIREIPFEEFPPLLREIPDAPKTLYVNGVLPSHRTKILTIVGARKHTEYGREAVERLVDGLRGHDIAIVSGLALGTDAIAHRAAIRAGLQTIAVPGSGLDPAVLYPRSHVRLAEEIIARGGALVSEFEPDFRATLWSFPKRNRIMAGMSHAVLITEAELKSGTLITSRLASDYNRDVLTIPGSIFSRYSEGPHMLIRLGATPIRSSSDILEALGFKEKAARQKALPLDLSPDERKVYELLAEPVPRDELIARLGLDTSKANILLSTMELKGLISESLGAVRIA